MTSVLLAEDDPSISEPLARALRREGYEVGVSADGPGTFEVARAGGIDLIVLDIGLPRMDGLEVCRRLRLAGQSTPVLILTARVEEVDTVIGLDAGADDYVAKPFRLAELLARVRVRLRGEVIRAGEVTLDVGRLVADAGGGPVHLTRLEFLLLRELAEHLGQSVPKGRLLSSVWGYHFDPGSNVVDVCVRRLRSKLGFNLIKTVRGEGYQLGDG